MPNLPGVITLDSVHQLLTKMSADLGCVNDNLEVMNTRMPAVETRVDDKIEELKATMENRLKDIKQEILDENARVMDKLVEECVAPIQTEIDIMQKKLTKYDDQLERLTDDVATPYHLDRSIVIYELKKSGELSNEELAYDFMTETLQLEVTIINVDRTKPWGKNQWRVIKVEFKTLEWIK